MITCLRVWFCAVRRPGGSVTFQVMYMFRPPAPEVRRASTTRSSHRPMVAGAFTTTMGATAVGVAKMRPVAFTTYRVVLGAVD